MVWKAKLWTRVKIINSGTRGLDGTCSITELLHSDDLFTWRMNDSLDHTPWCKSHNIHCVKRNETRDHYSQFQCLNPVSEGTKGVPLQRKSSGAYAPCAWAARDTEKTEKALDARWEIDIYVESYTPRIEELKSYFKCFSHSWDKAVHISGRYLV